MKLYSCYVYAYVYTITLIIQLEGDSISPYIYKEWYYKMPYAPH